jgi:hypothetical protein
VIQISIKSNLQQILPVLTNVQTQQVPFALAHALTMTAQRVRIEEQRSMRDTFDRPTPYTLAGLRYSGATKADLTSSVYVIGERTSGNTPQATYLKTEVTGGLRGAKPFEKSLQAIGLLPPGHVAVPGSAAEIDAFGNMSRKQINQILGYFKAQGVKPLTEKRIKSLGRTTKKREGFAYFVGAPAGGRLPYGIWQRMSDGRRIKPVLIFVPQAAYHAVYKFEDVARATVERDFDRQFQASLALAVATAR